MLRAPPGHTPDTCNGFATPRNYPMKTPRSRAKTLTLLMAAAVLPAGGQAANLFWDANAATANQTDGAGAWLATNQWWNGTSNTTWTSGDNATFGNGGTGGAVTITGPTTLNSLTFNYFAGTYTVGTAGQVLTLNNGITKKAGAGLVNFSSPIVVGAAQTWTNYSATSLMMAAVDNGGFLLTIDGSAKTGFESSVNNIISGSGGLIKNGTGVLWLGGGAAPIHTYTGTTTLNGGGILYSGNVAPGNITINNGYIEQYWTTTISRALGAGAGQIQILGGVSGFSGAGASAAVFTITGVNPIIWGSAYFNPAALLLGAASANTNGKGSLTNGLDLAGVNRTITSTQAVDATATSGFTLSGVISNSTGTAGIIRTGTGNTILTAANTYNGSTTIFTGGSITLSGSGTITNTSALNLNGGMLRLINSSSSPNRLTDSAPINSSGGSITYENVSGATVYTETIGALGLVSGATHLVLATTQASTGSQTLTINTGGLTRTGANNTASITFSALGTGPQATGNKSMLVVTGAGTTNSSEIIGPWATTGTATTAQTDYAVYSGNTVVPANIAGSAQSTWSSSYAVTSNYTMANAPGAATTLTGTRSIHTLRTTSTTASPTVDFATDLLTLTALTFSDGDVIAFGGTAPGGTTTGTAYYIRDVVGTSFKVALTSGGAAIDLTNAGTPNITGGLALSTGNNLGTFGILNAQGSGLAIGASGSGVVTLPTNSAGQLTINPGNGAAIAIGAPVVDNTGTGILTLVKNGGGTLRLDAVNTYTGETVINAGTLQIGTNGIANGAQLGSGVYVANIFLGVGATLSFQSNASQTLSGIISGDGALTKINTSTLTLTGANTYTGKTILSALTTAGSGTLIISSFNSVVGGTASSSLGAPTTVANGTIDIGASGVQGSAILKYIGAGETTDRIINFPFNSTSTRTLDASNPTGILRFTSAFTSNGTATSHVDLIGTGIGQIDQGLGFSFTKLTKSGAGTWTIGGAIGNFSLLTINAGTLALQQKSSLLGGNTAAWTNALINVKLGATLALNVDDNELAGLNSTSLDLLLSGISIAGSTTLGLQAGAILALDTSTATNGTFTQGNAIANSTGTNGGAIGLTKLGVGTLLLDKANSYTGPTKVNAGVLHITGSLGAATTVTVAAGAKFIFSSSNPLQIAPTLNGANTSSRAILAGTGTIAAAVTLNQIGDTLAPGTDNSPGILGFSVNQTWATFSYDWKINSFANTAVAGTHYDQLSIGGYATLTGSTPGAYLLNLVSLNSVNIVGGVDAFTNANRGWTIITTVWPTSDFNLANWTINDSAFRALNPGLDGTFSLNQVGSDLVLNFAAVPEPSTFALGGCAALALALLSRRRRAQGHQAGRPSQRDPK